MQGEPHLCLLPSSSTDSHGLPSGGGLWLRPQDIIYIDRKFYSDLASIRHLSLRNIWRLAIDASLLSPKTPDHGFHSSLDEILTYFQDVKRLVFAGNDPLHTITDDNSQREEARKTLPSKSRPLLSTEYHSDMEFWVVI